jgi:hypothetical protein
MKTVVGRTLHREINILQYQPHIKTGGCELKCSDSVSNTHFPSSTRNVTLVNNKR